MGHFLYSSPELEDGGSIELTFSYSLNNRGRRNNISGWRDHSRFRNHTHIYVKI